MHKYIKSSIALAIFLLFLSVSTGYSAQGGVPGGPPPEEPAPTEPAPEEPAPEEPAPTDPEMTDPTATESMSSTSSMTTAPTESSSESGDPIGLMSLAEASANPNTGAAIASIPIVVAPGRLGVEPKLALNYNSNAKGSWVGTGWDLTLGHIQRNTKHGIDYSSDDYIVGGVELTPRTDWCPTGCYGKKIEREFSRYYKTPGGGWEVTNKNGTKLFFGTTTASRLEDPNDSSKVFKWMLDKVEDSNGNYMTVSYTKDGGTDYQQLYPLQIDYTGNVSGLATTNYVKFHLETKPLIEGDDTIERDNAYEVYHAGFAIKTAYRLKTIEVNAGAEMVRAYALTYTDSIITIKSQLSTVTQYGTDAALDGSGTVTGGTSLPPTTVTFGEEAKEFNPGGIPIVALSPADYPLAITNTNSMYRFNADFNGDGRTDYMWYKSGWNVALAQPDGTLVASQWLDTSSSGLVTKTAYDATMHVADFDGDGKSDYMWRKGSGWNVALSDGTKFKEPTQWLPNSAGGVNTYSSLKKYAHIADLTGDGLPDYFFYKNSWWYMAENNGAGFEDPQKWLFKKAHIIDLDGLGTTYQYTYPSDEGYQCFCDFNGDGKIDYMWYRDG
ncbi:MAG: SpvB/TcaC N-terminal domain-containing protein, partial [Thermodesulfobacteriota bacterium]